jgi:hypothetical protein
LLEDPKAMKAWGFLRCRNASRLQTGDQAWRDQTWWDHLLQRWSGLLGPLQDLWW